MPALQTGVGSTQAPLLCHSPPEQVCGTFPAQRLSPDSHAPASPFWELTECREELLQARVASIRSSTAQVNEALFMVTAARSSGSLESSQFARLPEEDRLSTTGLTRRIGT